MKKLLLILLLTIVGTVLNAQDVDSHYQYAFEQIEAMLVGKREANFKEAVYLTENAYQDGLLDVKKVDSLILLIAEECKYTQARLMPNYKEADSLSIRGNLAIYKYMTEPEAYLDATGLHLYESFQYDFNDPFAQIDWTNMFVSKLLATQKGNCHSLPYLYKIIADELDVEAHLALAPNHLYVKHPWKNSKGGWYNTELTNRSFPSDAWLTASGYINLQAIQNGLYLEALTEKQSVAMVLIDLAQGYMRKVDRPSEQDFLFQLQCIDLALAYFPHYINGLLFKAEVLKKYNDWNASKVTQHQLEQLCSELHQLGYQQIANQTYLAWLAGKLGIEEEMPYDQALYQEGYKPYQAFQESYLALKKEIPVIQSDTVLIGNIMFDVEQKKVLGQQVEFVMSADLVARWLSTDPLVSKFPNWSPYNSFADNPIRYIDPDGREVDDAAMKDKSTGQYYDAFLYFAKTEMGRDFMRIFTNGNDTELTSVTSAGKGRFSDHKLEFTNESGRGSSTIFLEKKDGSRVVLEKVTEADVKEGVRFIFQINVNKTYLKEAYDANTVGHEAFLHLFYRIPLLEKMMGNLDNLSYAQIAEELVDIGLLPNRIDPKTNARLKGDRGEADHNKIVMGTDKDFQKFIKQLSEILPEDQKRKSKQDYDDMKKEYIEDKKNERWHLHLKRRIKKKVK